jgi:hypothetical protein
MQRRQFLAGTAGAAVTMANAQTPTSTKKQAFFELQYFYSRNTMSDQKTHLTDWLTKQLLPAVQKAGFTPAGLFTSNIGPNAPFYLMISSFASLSDWEASKEKLAAVDGFSAASESFYGQSSLPFERCEVRLLKAFPGFPQIEAPPAPAKGGHLFELRTYESNTPLSLKKKIGMFEQGGEIDIFRKTGVNPVFFGETIAGPSMPNLTYMTWYDSLAAREEAWKKFVSSPEWQKLRVQPGYSDGEVVSNISNLLLSPVAGSPIR